MRDRVIIDLSDNCVYSTNMKEVEVLFIKRKKASDELDTKPSAFKYVARHHVIGDGDEDNQRTVSKFFKKFKDKFRLYG